MFTRRTFLKYTGATTLTLFATGLRSLRRAIAEALPGRYARSGINPEIRHAAARSAGDAEGWVTSSSTKTTK